MSRAVLVTGAQTEFEAGFPYCAQSIRESGIRPVVWLRSSRIRAARFSDRFEGAVRDVPRTEPLLIAYEGHGNEGTWSPYRGRRHEYAYERLVLALSHRIAPTLIVNDCCDSWSLAETLLQARIEPRRVGAITSTHAGRCDSYDARLLGRVMSSWKRGRPFAAGENLWFAVSGSGRQGAFGEPLPGISLLTLWRTLISDGQRLHRQRISRWGTVTDLHFITTAS